MQVGDQPVRPLDDACIRCHVFTLDAPGLFKIMRSCCAAWCQSLPRYTRTFSEALKLLRRLSAHGSWVEHFGFYPRRSRLGGPLSQIRTDLLLLGCLLTMRQNSNVPNLLWQHQDLFWKYLKLGRVDFAWEVRQNAALILRDLCIRFRYRDIERELVALHDEAWTVFRSLRNKKTEAVEVYEALESLPLKFKTIQFNAALVAGDHQWLLHQWQALNSFNYLPMLCIDGVPSTPEATADESTSDTEL